MPGTEFEIKADLVILAIGFIKAEPSKDWQGKKVFLAGDIQRGPSLVVWALDEGRQAARAIDNFLKAPRQDRGGEGNHG